MKTKILLSIICACFLFKVQAQENTDSYFEVNSCWSYKVNLWSGFDYGWFVLVGRQSHLQNEITIEQKQYLQFDYYAPYSFTAIRQENQKVYAYDTNLEKEYLLYDFGVKEGDVIYSDAPGGYLLWGEPVVTKVDEVMLYNGEQRKRIFVNGGSDVWIEGIGSIYGFDFPVRDFVTCDCNSSYYLIAFAKEDDVSFFDEELAPQFGYCGNLKDGISETLQDKNVLTISQEENVLQINSHLKEIEKAALITIDGKKITQQNGQANTLNIDVTTLPKGIYLVNVLFSDKTNYSVKWIKKQLK